MRILFLLTAAITFIPFHSLIGYVVNDNLSISFENRIRYEGKFGAGGSGANNDFRATGVDNNNGFVTIRTTVSADWKPYDGVKLHLGVRDNRAENDDRGDASPRYDELDLFQAYVELTPNGGKSPFTLKLGRQEIFYGSHILMGKPNRYTSRVWDGARVIYKAEKFKFDSFAARVVVRDAEDRNERNDNEVVWGSYLSTGKVLDKWDTDFYVFGRNSSDDSGNRNIYAFGTRIKSKKNAFGNWGYVGEFIGQRGTFGANDTDLESYLIHLGTSYTAKNLPWKPKFSLNYMYSPGDGDAADDKSETFNLFFPGKNHPRAGRTDAIGWRNLHSLGLSVDAKPSKKLKAHASAHSYWVADTQDGLYGQGGGMRSKNGYGINPSYDSHVGSEVAAELKYKINKHWNTAIEYAHFFTGDYIDQSLAAGGGSKDSDQVFVTLSFKY